MALGPGSLAFTAFNADGDDDFAVVALQTIDPGTLYFSDNEWNGSAIGAGGAFTDLNESRITWTIPTAISAGTVVTFNAISAATRSASVGTITAVGNTGLAAGGDAIYAYGGTDSSTPTAFLAYVSSDGPGQGSTANTGLTVGTTAVSFTGNPDGFAYTGPRSGQAGFADYLAAIGNTANYRVEASEGAAILPIDATAFTTGGGAAPQAVGFAAASANLTRAELNAGTSNFTFTVERTGGAAGAVSFSGQLASTSADAADFAGAGAVPFGFSGTIPDGAASATVTIEVQGDATPEPNESFTLTLQSASNADATIPTSVRTAGATATGTIQNDDAAGPQVGGITILPEAPSLQGVAGTPAPSGTLDLVRLGAFQATGTGGNAEVVSFDPTSKQLFILNAVVGKVEVVRIEASGALAKTGEIVLTGLPDFGGANSVAVKNGVVAVAYQNVVITDPGRVALFDTAGALATTLVVGALPDQLTFTPDGSRLLVANEATATTTANDPAGSVSIITIPATGAASATVSCTIGFGGLDGSEAVLSAKGLALLPGRAASRDIEPEYISVSPDGTRAYVTLQEVNGLAVIDLTNPAATAPLAILPLGGVDRSLPGNELDASDRDGGINIVALPVLSLLQPDSVASFTVGGQTYVITANEGDARENLADSVRLGNAAYVLDPTAFPDAAALKADAVLGRLNVLATRGDADGDGDIDRIVTLGGRGVSIFRQEADGSLTKVRETGGEFERIVAAQANAGTIFNQNQGSGFDTRSDDKGPEPEGVAIGTVAGRTYAFVGLERVGGVMAYDVTDPANAGFASYEAPTASDAGPEVLTFISAADSPTGVPLVVSANEVSGTTTVYSALTPIYAIQGEGHASPYAGQTVTTQGIVTAIQATGGTRGFYVQDALGDGNAATSDGIFVFRTAAQLAGAQVGDLVQVTGAVSEFRGSGRTSDLTLTQFGSAASLAVVSSGNVLPAEVVLGAGGRVPPTVAIDDDGLAVFQPSQDAADFFESLEGMRVQVGPSSVVGPTNNFGEVFVAADGAFDPASRNVRGGLTIGSGDFNPERIQLDNIADAVSLPAVDVGARLGAASGVLSYSFGNYEVLVGAAPSVTAASPLQPEVTGVTRQGGRDLTFGTYNVENLDPVVERTINPSQAAADNDDDVGSGRYAQIAGHIVTNMGAPTIVALQEIQDDSGGVNNGVVSADVTLQTLVDAIRAAGGPTYAFAYLSPENNQDGGQPGANIRNAFLYQDALVDLVPGSLQRLTDANLSDGDAFASSRKPLVAQFEAGGETTTFVNNHFNSKGGDTPLFGSVQPLVLGSEAQRVAQAGIVNAYVDGLLAADPNARVVVLGDLNDFSFSNPLRTLDGTINGGARVLTDLGEALVTDPRERYDYVFEGNSQDLDHIYVSNAVLAASPAYDVVHVNSEFDAAQSASDHDPIVARTTTPTYRLQILHASDWEAGLNALDRAPNMAAIFDRLEDLEANSITLSTGDGWIPGPFFAAGGDPALAANYRSVYNEFYGLAGTGYGALAASVGRADITIQNIIGVQAANFGNHEFDSGTTEVANIIGANFGATTGNPGVANDVWLGAQFPYLSANLDFSGEPALNPLFTSNVLRGAETYATGPAQSAAYDTQTAAQRAEALKKIAPATVITENGERIGLVGATTQEDATLSSLGGVTVIGPDVTYDGAALAAILQPTIDALTASGINKIVVMSHLQQLAFEKDLATRLRGVDVIIAGGSHTLQADATDILRPQDRIEDTYPFQTVGADGKPVVVVNTASEYSYVGRLVVEFDAQGDIIPSSLDPAVNGAYVTTDEEVASLYGGNYDAAFTNGSKGDLVRQIVQGTDATAGVNDGIREVINVQDGNTFGRTDVYLDGIRNSVRTEETNLGDLSADANLFYARQYDPTVQVSIKNGGGIRDAIGSFAATGGGTAVLPPAANPSAGKEAGEVSQLDIANSLRFNNALSLVTVTAAELLTVIENGVSQTAPGATPGRFSQVGGLAYAYDATRPAGDRILSLALTNDAGQITRVIAENGEVVGDPDTPIRVVTLNFLAGGGDGYPFSALGENRVDLLGAPVPTGAADVANFAPAGSEQDAFAEYMAAFFGTTPYAQADTTQAGDLRVQNVAARADTVLAGSFNLAGTDAAELLAGRDAADTISAGAGADTVVGAAGDDVLYGGEGNDTGYGDDGNDFLDMGAGDDLVSDILGSNTLKGAEGSDTIVAGAGADVLVGGADDDALYGGAGNDTGYGDDGNDVLDMGAGDDFVSDVFGSNTLVGGDGNDTIVTGAGADLLAGAAGDDVVYGGEGNDTGYGDAGNDFLDLGAGDDRIFGGAGNDSLVGGTGADTLAGGDGTDILAGGAGADALFGGAGADTFAFGAADLEAGVSDFIGDFGTGDIVILSTAAQGRASYSAYATGTLITVDTGAGLHGIYAEGATMTALQAQTFYA